MSHRRQSGRPGFNNSGGQRRNNNPRQAGLYQSPPEYQHMPAAPFFQRNMYHMPVTISVQQAIPPPYAVGEPFLQNLQDPNSDHQQSNMCQTPRPQAFVSNNQPPRHASPAPSAGGTQVDAPPPYNQICTPFKIKPQQPISNSNITQNIDGHTKEILNEKSSLKPNSVGGNIPAHWNPNSGEGGEKVSRGHKSVRGAQECGNTKGRGRGARGPTKGRSGLGGFNGGSESDMNSLQQMLASVKLDESSSTKQIIMSVTDAIYVKYHYLDALRQAHPGPTINISLGSELSTLVIKGNAAEVTAVKQAVEEYKGTLKSRKMTIASPQWQFLNSRKSRANLHFNGGELKTLGVQYYCTQKGTHQLVMLTATSTDDLSRAENILRRDIVVEKYEIESQQKWKDHIKPDIVRLFHDRGYPLHLVEPDEGAAAVTIVIAKFAEGILKKLLSAAKGGKTPTVMSASKSKTRKSKEKAEKVGGSSTPAVSDMSFGAIPKRSHQPILNLTIDDLLDVAMRVRVTSPIPSPLDLGRNMFSEEVKLTKNHQYIEYQFLSHYCHQVLDEESSVVTMDERTVTIRSSSAEEAKRVKNRLVNLIEHRSNKETREVQNGVNEKVFENAAKDLTLWFLVNSSKQLLDYTIGNVSVVACKPSIQCIKADAVIIAVKNDLYMNQSGVGAVLAIADPKASKELRSRYDSDNLDSAGSCQELESYDSPTLYRLYQVIVVDPKDKNSLRMGFSNALRRCESLNISTVVTNLLGSDMKGFVSDKESASILLSCISEHVRCLEKTRLQTVYMCETNERKVDTLVSEIKKYGRGVQFMDSSLPQAGSTMVSIFSHTKKEGDEFFRRCAHYLA